LDCPFTNILWIFSHWFVLLHTLPETKLTKCFCLVQTLTTLCLHFFLSEDLPRNLLVYFTTTIHPDEMFFQTIAYNTHFRAKTYEYPNSDIILRFSKWSDPNNSDVDMLGIASLN
jgi:hypothetical protein